MGMEVANGKHPPPSPSLTRTLSLHPHICLLNDYEYLFGSAHGQLFSTEHRLCNVNHVQ